MFDVSSLVCNSSQMKHEPRKSGFQSDFSTYSTRAEYSLGVLLLLFCSVFFFFLTGWLFLVFVGFVLFCFWWLVFVLLCF